MAAEGVDLDTVTAIFKKLKATDERGELYVFVTGEALNIKFPAERRCD